MGRRTLVTGGAGFIGSAVVPELEKHGHEIHVLDNLSFGRRELIAVPDERFLLLDIRDREAVRAAVQEIQPHWIVHLAAIHFIPYCNAHPAETADINLWGTVNVLDAARETASVEKLLFPSTAAVYPVSDEALGEEHEVGPLDVYGTTKYVGERLCREYHLETGRPTTICRLFNAYGPNETNPHVIPEIQRQVNEGRRTIQLGNLDPKRDFIHTHDMARAMRLLLEQEHAGCQLFNLGRGIEYSVREIVEAFERQLGEEITIEVDPARVRAVDRMHLLADISRLRQATGWEPEWGIDEGVRTLIAAPHGAP